MNSDQKTAAFLAEVARLSNLYGVRFDADNLTLIGNTPDPWEEHTVYAEGIQFNNDGGYHWTKPDGQIMRCPASPTVPPLAEPGDVVPPLADDVLTVLMRYVDIRRGARRRGPRIHLLKTWPAYFDAVVSGAKTFEVRTDDRGIALGDVLRLREWDPTTSQYSGRDVLRVVTYILRDGPFAIPGQAVFAIAPLENAEQDLAPENRVRVVETLDKALGAGWLPPIVKAQSHDRPVVALQQEVSKMAMDAFTKFANKINKKIGAMVKPGSSYKATSFSVQPEMFPRPPAGLYWSVAAKAVACHEMNAVIRTMGCLTASDVETAFYIAGIKSNP